MDLPGPGCASTLKEVAMGAQAIINHTPPWWCWTHFKGEIPWGIWGSFLKNITLAVLCQHGKHRVHGYTTGPMLLRQVEAWDKNASCRMLLWNDG